MKLFDGTKIPILGKAMDAYAMRHKVIAANLANIQTAGYRAKTVSFEEELTSASQGGVVGASTNDRHIAVGASSPFNVAAKIVEPPPDAKADQYASGINDVDLDREMAEMAKNQIRAKFASRLLGDSFRGIQKSIRGTL